MKQLLPFFLLMLACSTTQAQNSPISISVNSGMSHMYTSTSFDRQFEYNEHMDIRVLDLAYYKNHKVRKIEFNYAGGGLYWSCVFDTSGRMIEEGRIAGNYFVIEQNFSDQATNSNTVVRSFYLKSKLMRRDSIISTNYRYQQHDTLIAFTRSQNIIYYKGALLNEQNNYYNERFLNVPVSEAQTNSPLFAISAASKKPSDHIYLRKKLKTDYDTATLYRCSQEIRDNGYATADSGRKTLFAENLRQHPFGQQMNSEDCKDCFVDGACFDEPHFIHETYMCGTGMREMHEHEARTSYGLSTGAKGLYDTFYSEYHAEPDISLGVVRSPARSERSTILNFSYEFFE